MKKYAAKHQISLKIITYLHLKVPHIPNHSINSIPFSPKANHYSANHYSNIIINTLIHIPVLITHS